MKALFLANIDGFHKSFHIPHIRHLKQLGYDIDVASRGELFFEDANQKFDVSFGRAPFDIDNVKAFFQLKRLFRNHYDLIYISTPVPGVLGRLALIHNKNARVVYSAHGFSFYKGNSRIRNLIFLGIEKALSRYTDCIVAMNAEDYTACINHRFHCNEIYNVDGVGIETERFHKPSIEEKSEMRKQYGFNQDDFLIIYPAELSHRKNQRILFDIIEVLNKKYSNVQLLLVGKGVLLDEYKSIIKDKRLDAYVKLMGYRTDVQNLLKCSDILCASSLNEGLPISMIEAMSTGLPIVATKARGHIDLVKEGENGFLFDFNDTEKAIGDITLLIENEDNIYRRMSDKSESMAKRYDISNVVLQYDKIWGINKTNMQNK